MDVKLQVVWKAIVVSYTFPIFFSSVNYDISRLINNLQAICTCDWQSLPKQQNKPKPPPKARVVYMFPANGDSGSNGLYYYMKSFASYMMQNEQAGEIYDYRYIRLAYTVVQIRFG